VKNGTNSFSVSFSFFSGDFGWGVTSEVDYSWPSSASNASLKPLLNPPFLLNANEF
jgi:hypothetical protein